MTLRTGAAVALLFVSIAALAGCSPGSDAAAPAQSDRATASGTPSPEASGSQKPTPTPTPTTKKVTLPSDCKQLLSADVLAQLKDIPLNDPAFGDSGLRADGTQVCHWADPKADTTGLTTTISTMSRGPALDMLNKLADDEGFTCYTPDGGTRCEKSWPNKQYPVTDGRTLFWRDDVLIDTRYSNLAPKGYTSSIVQTLWG